MPYRLILDDGAVVTVPRVTEVVEAGMPKPAIVAWERRGAVRWAADHPVAARHDPDAALRGFQRQQHAAQRGQTLHAWIAAMVAEEPMSPLPASHRGYQEAFSAWAEEHHPVLAGALLEQTLCDYAGTVAGRADCILADGHLIDWKTTETLADRPWPDHVAQLGAYASMVRLVDDKGRVGEISPFVAKASVVQLVSNGEHRTWTWDRFNTDDRSLHQAMALWRAVPAW